MPRIRPAPSRSPEGSPARMQTESEFTPGTALSTASRQFRFWMHHGAITTFEDKTSQLLHLRRGAGGFKKFLRPPGKRPLLRKQHRIGLPERCDDSPRESPPPQPTKIDPRQAGAAARAQAEREEIREHAAHASDHRMAADPAMLMDSAATAKHHVVPQLDMSGQGRRLPDNYVVANHAVMRDMGSDHDQASRTHPGQTAAAIGADMDRDVLPNDRVFSDFQLAVLAGVFQILRNLADHRTRKDPHPRTESGATGDMDMRTYLDAGLQLHLAADDAVRPNGHAFAQFGPGIHDCCLVYRRTCRA